MYSADIALDTVSVIVPHAPSNGSAALDVGLQFVPRVGTPSPVPSIHTAVPNKYTVVAGAVGSYELSVTLTGTAASLYALAPVPSERNSYLDVMDHAIAGPLVPPPLPLLLNAVLSDDGRSFDIIFDGRTDRARVWKQFQCDLVFSFIGDSTALCEWIDDSSVRVSVIRNVYAVLIQCVYPLCIICTCYTAYSLVWRLPLLTFLVPPSVFYAHTYCIFCRCGLLPTLQLE